MNLANWFRRVTTCLTCISLCTINPIVISNANAQPLDLDPPQVDHVPTEEGIAGDLQSITVIATDSRGIDRVVLFYKLNGALTYETKRMTLLSEQNPSLYATSLATKTTDRQLSYYFEVIDTGGNRVLNALPFSPHIRNLTAPIDTNPVASDQALGEQLKKPRNWLYIAAGVLIIGLISRQSSGSSSTSNEQDTPATVPVTVEVPTP